MLAQYPGAAQPSVKQQPTDVIDVGRPGSNAGESVQGFLQPSVGRGPVPNGGGPDGNGGSVEKKV